MTLPRTAFFAALLLCTCLPAVAQTPTLTELHLLDPTTIYSFRGLDGKGFLRRQPINIPEPAYPGRQTGFVILMATVSPSGSVSAVALEPNQSGLATTDMVRAAKAAVLQWKFAPLPSNQLQSDQLVRVLIQFNHPNSPFRYTEEGNIVIKGLVGRRPLNLYSPSQRAYAGGVVTLELALSPEGKVAWVDQFYGAVPEEEVDPHLGLRAYEAVSQWQFEPVQPPETDEETKDRYQRVTVTVRFLPDQYGATLNARLSGPMRE